MKPSANASLAARVRDPRIDLTRGIANWFIFLDHIPHNAVNLLTLRNFGFSGAADLFIFVAGYAAALFYGRMARERGLVVTTTRIFRRLWQLYAAYVVLFVIYIDVVSNVAAQYAATEIIDEYNVIGLVDQPTQTLMHGLLLQAKPLNLDTLQLFIVLMAFFPLILWSMMRWPRSPDRSCSIPPRAISAGALPPSLRGPGISIRIAGSSCSCSAPGSR